MTDTDRSALRDRVMSVLTRTVGGAPMYTDDVIAAIAVLWPKLARDRKDVVAALTELVGQGYVGRRGVGYVLGLATVAVLLGDPQ